MDKVIKHLKNNAAIYLVLFVCIVIILISLFITHDDREKIKVAKVDTSLFEVVTLKEALELFDQPNPVLLIIGLDTCSATINYVPYLQYAEIEHGFSTYYLELSSINKSQIEEYNKLVEKLDIEYNSDGKVDKFGKFIGTTPMTIIIKNKKQVYGYIGSMNDTTLETITKNYGVATK